MYVNHKPCAYSTQKRNDPDGLFESHFVPATVYNSGIAGWYIHPSDMDWVDEGISGTPENAMWNNRGSGPEISHDEIHGPFRSESKAWAWVGQRTIAEVNSMLGMICIETDNEENETERIA